MNIVFFGSGAFGLPTLRALSSSHTLKGIVTQPDRPAGRGGKPTPTPVGEWAAANLPRVPILQPERCGTQESMAFIQNLLPPGDTSAWVVIAYGQKLPAALLAERFAINLHASLLPRWRGAAPINAALLAGDTQTGNSVITLADRMDAGLILAQTRREIANDQTAGDLHDELAEDGPALIERVLAEHAGGASSGLVQAEAHVTVAPKISRSDAWVDFEGAADHARRRINALSPKPGVTVLFRGLPLKLVRATVDMNESDAREVAVQGSPMRPRPHAPGDVLSPARGLVMCGAGSMLKLLEVQPAGKRPMLWKDFANGHRVQSQERLAGGQSPCSPCGT